MAWLYRLAMQKLERLQIADVLAGMLGPQAQIPPMHSAIRIGGMGSTTRRGAREVVRAVHQGR